MLKLFTIFVAIFAFAQASDPDKMQKQLTEMNKILDDITYEQLKRAIGIISEKRKLCKNNDCENCVGLEGNKYLVQINDNNRESTAAFRDKIKECQEKVKTGKMDDAGMDTMREEHESVLTKMQAKGEGITLDYVRVANKCRGE